MILKAAICGLIGMMILLVSYFSVVSLISGLSFALSQFGRLRFPERLNFGDDFLLYLKKSDSVIKNSA